MKKALILAASALAVIVLGLAAVVVMLAPGGERDSRRSEREMSRAEQRELLQSFFTTPLPRELKNVRIRSDLPAMGDGEVHASFQVLPEEAAVLVEGLRPLKKSGDYRGPRFEGADGVLHVDRASGKVRIDWIEH